MSLKRLLKGNRLETTDASQASPSNQPTATEPQKLKLAPLKRQWRDWMKEFTSND